MTEVKRLPPDRWREYRALRLEALETDPSAFATSVEEDAALPEEEWRRRCRNTLFAVSEDKPVGMIGYVVGNRVKTKHVADIFAVYVTPSRRGEGIGTVLLAKALAEIRKNDGIRKVKLQVNPRQREAVRLYQRAGFEVAGLSKREMKVGRTFHDLLLMERQL